MKRILFVFLCLGSLIASAFSSFTSEGERKLTDEEFGKIAQSHNDYLESLFFDFNWNDDNLVAQLNNKALEISAEDDLGLKDDASFFNLEGCDNDCLLSKFGEESQLLIKEAIQVIDSSKDLAGIRLGLKEVRIKTQNIEDVTEYNQVNAALAVFESSSEFWLPIQDGGNGKGQLIIGNLRSTNGDCSRAIIKADGLAFGSGLIVSAIIAGLAGGPVTAGAFFGYVGIRAAVASAWSALENC